MEKKAKFTEGSSFGNSATSFIQGPHLFAPFSPEGLLFQVSLSIIVYQSTQLSSGGSRTITFRR